MGFEAFNLIKNATKQILTNITEFNKKSVDLQMVTGNTAKQTQEMINNYNKMAINLGATTGQVTDGASEWLRQGKSTVETNKLIKDSMILSKVGMMDSEVATKSLTSAMKGYKLEVEEVSTVTDKLTAVDMSAAVTASDIAESMSRTSNGANIAGLSIDKLIGYLTVMQEVTQKSASSIGESWKTVLTRMGNIKIGQFIDDDGEDLSDVEKILGHFDIKLRDTKENFRNFGDVLDEVGDRWGNFSNVEQRAISNAFAGVRQQENFLALMENYQKALEYTEISANSAGTAMQKFNAYSEGIEAHTNRFIASFESLSMNTLDSNLLKGIIDTGTALITVIDKLDLLKTSLIGLATFGAIKGFVTLKVAGIETAKSFEKMNTAMKMIKTIDSSSSIDDFKKLGIATTGLSNAQLKLILSNKNLQLEQLETILTSQGLSKAEAQAKLQTLGLATATTTATTATGVFKGAILSLSAAFASNPIGITIMTLTTVVSVFSTISNNAKQKAEEARQTISDTAQEAKAQSDNLFKLINQYSQLSQSQVKDENIRNQLLDVQKEMVQLLGEEKEGLDLVNGSYESQIDILQKLSLERLNEMRQSLLAQQQLAKSKTDEAFLFGDLREGYALDYREKLFKNPSIELQKIKDANIPNLKVSFDSWGSGIGAKAIGSPEQQVKAWTDAISVLEKYNLSNSNTYTDMVKIRDTYRQVLDKENEATQNLNEHIANQNIIMLQAKNGVPQTSKEFELFKENLLETAGANDKLKICMENAVNSAYPQLIGSLENINNQADILIGTFNNGTLQNISDISNDVKLLGTSLSEFKNSGVLTSATLNNLQTELQATDDDLINLQNAFSSGNEENLKKSLQDIALSYLSSKVSVQQLSDEEKKQLQLELASIGVKIELSEIEKINANEIQNTANTKSASQISSTNFVNATTNEINALLDQARAANLTAESITELSRRKDLISKKESLKKFQPNDSFQDTVNKHLQINKINQELSKEFNFTADTIKSEFDPSKFNIDWGKLLDVTGAKNAAKDINSAINNLLSMTMNMIKQRYADEKEAIQKQIEALNEKYNLEKDSLDEIGKIKDKQHQDEKKALEDKLKALEKQRDLQLEALQVQKDEYYWNKKLNEHNKTIGDLESELAIVSLDPTLEGKAKAKELREQLEKAKEELKDDQFDNSIKNQEDAINKEFDKNKELYDNKIDILDRLEDKRKENHQAELDRIQKEHDAQLKALQDQMKAIDEKTKYEGKIRSEAIDLLNKKSSKTYQELIEWNKLYGSGVDQDVKNSWDNAYLALSKFNGGQINILKTLNELSKRMNTFVNQVNDAANGLGGLKVPETTTTPSSNDNSNSKQNTQSELARLQKIKNEYLQKDMKVPNALEDKIKKLQSQLANMETHHTGFDSGFAGGEKPLLKHNEILAKLVKGELVLTPKDIDNLMYSVPNVAKQMIERSSPKFNSESFNMSPNVEIHQGDVIIQGNADSNTVNELKKMQDSFIKNAEKQIFSKINSDLNIKGARKLRIV
ncbi:MAG: phage tail tape measure protein [Oscillospiraceae bacterium]